jgi:hypothetical protein
MTLGMNPQEYSNVRGSINSKRRSGVVVPHPNVENDERNNETMTRNAVSRRKMLVAEPLHRLEGRVSAERVARKSSTLSTVTNEEIVRKYYKAWEKKD